MMVMAVTAFRKPLRPLQHDTKFCSVENFWAGGALESI